jgi:hypothetical protein
MRGGVYGALQLGDQFRHGTVEIAGDVANASPVMRLARLNSDGLKQQGGWHVVGMGDKWDRHPGTDWLTCHADVARLAAGPVGE